MHAPFRIEELPVLRGKAYLITLLLEIAHDPARGDLLDKRFFELLFRDSPTRDKGQRAQPEDEQRFPHSTNQVSGSANCVPRRSSYFDELFAAAFLSTALAPLKIPNMP